jgi:hypothetical protein
MRSSEAGSLDPADLTIVPANEATWADLAAIFGASERAPVPELGGGRSGEEGGVDHGRGIGHVQDAFSGTASVCWDASVSWDASVC